MIKTERIWQFAPQPQCEDFATLDFGCQSGFFSYWLRPLHRTVERLMGTRAELRFEFSQERAEFARDEMLDV